MTHLLTFQGTLLCQVAISGGLSLGQRSVDAIGDDSELVSVDLPVEQLRHGFDDYLVNAPADLDRVVTIGRPGAVAPRSGSSLCHADMA